MTDTPPGHNHESPDPSELPRRSRQLRAINELAVELPLVRSVEGAAARICERLREVTGARFVGMTLLSPAAKQLRSIAGSGRPEVIAALERVAGCRLEELRFPFDKYPAPEMIAVKARKMTGVRQLMFDGPPQEFADRLATAMGVEDCYGLTLHCGDELLGTICVMMPPGAPELSIEVLETCANIAGAAVWQKRAEAELRRSRQGLEKRIRERSADLSEQNEELERVNRQLEQLHRAKDQFVATISHELRTPLVTGRGYVELLASGTFGELSRDGAAAARTALRNLGRLSNLIDGVLQYQRLTLPDRRASVTLLPVDVLGVFKECAEDFLFRTGWSESQLTIDIPEELPCALADDNLLRQAITNLLDNIQQHAGELANVTLSACLGDEGRIRVSVIDDGRGMAPELLDRVTEPFVKHNSSGTGLGLAIVARACEALGSRLELSSTPGNGTSAAFSMVTSRRARRPVTGHSGALPGASTAPPAARVLVVDDDNDTLEFVNLILGNAGYSVTTAACGQSALEILASERFDLALVDLTMPGIDGFELCRRIKSQSPTKNLTVYMFTARAEDAARQEACSVGADGYIIKPFLVRDFLATVRKALAKDDHGDRNRLD